MQYVQAAMSYYNLSQRCSQQEDKQEVSFTGNIYIEQVQAVCSHSDKLVKNAHYYGWLEST